jgi:amino acid permease
MKKSVLLGSLSLVGTIIGAGIFGVPYVFSRAGIVSSLLYCVLLGAAALTIHWFYAQVAAATPGKHRLVGYVRRHLGRRFAEVATVTNPMGLLGSMLAYMILGGGFLATLFGGSLTVWGLVFLAVMAALIFLPFRRIEGVEAGLTWLLIAAAVIIIAVVAPNVRLENMIAFSAENWFLPYGVIFFAFGGASVIPDLVESLDKDLRLISRAVIIGTAFSVALTAVFGCVIAGASGAGTTENAVAGLIPIVGRYIVAAGAVFGLLAVATSFVTIGENVKEVFSMDFRLSELAAWCAVIALPLAAFLFGARDFIAVLGFIGAFLTAADGFFISFMARKLARGPTRRLAIPLIALFLLGAVSEIYSLIIH